MGIPLLFVFPLRMGNNEDFKKFLLEHEDEEQTDVILRKMLDSIEVEENKLIVRSLSGREFRDEKKFIRGAWR